MFKLGTIQYPMRVLLFLRIMNTGICSISVQVTDLNVPRCGLISAKLYTQYCIICGEYCTRSKIKYIICSLCNVSYIPYIGVNSIMNVYMLHQQYVI